MVVFEMIRPICASFPRCAPRVPRCTGPARVAANRRGFRATASSVEALLNATFRGKDEVGETRVPSDEGAKGRVERCAFARPEARKGRKVYGRRKSGNALTEKERQGGRGWWSTKKRRE